MSSTRTETPTAAAVTLPENGVRTYVVLWISQWLACAATSFTVFIAGANIYLEFDSWLLIAIGYAINFVPFPVISPLSGAFVDRFGHRPALLIANVGTLANLLVLALVMAAGAWTPMYAMVVLGVSAFMRAFQLSAIESVVPLLVPKRHYGRANGPRMLMTGTFVLAGPIGAVALLGFVPPVGIILGECVLVALAIVIVVVLRLPRLSTTEGQADARSLRDDVAEGWRFLTSRRGLMTMAVYLAIVSGLLGALEVAASGAILGFADETGAVVVSLSCWFGMVLASIAMVVFGLPRRLVAAMLAAGLVFAVALGAASVRPSVVLMAIGGFLAMASLAVVIAIFQTLMHLKVPAQFLGRVVGIKNTFVTVAHIIGDVGAMIVGIALLSGGAAAEGGVWGWSEGLGWQDVSNPVLAAFIGDGPGRGWALVMMLMGLGVLAYVVFIATRRPSFRHLETDLPDVVPGERGPGAGDAAPASAPSAAHSSRVSGRTV